MDYKAILTVGAVAVCMILAVKLDPAQAKDVAIHVADAIKECAVASNCAKNALA